MATLQDYAKSKGVNLGYDPTTKKVTVGTTEYTPDQLKQSGLTLSGGRWQGTDEQLSLLNKPVETVKAPETTVSSTVSTPNYNNQINSLYQNQTDALVNQLRQKIAQSKQEQQNIIANAPKQFDPMRAQSELTKSQQLRQVLERNANLGDRGGVGRSQALQTQTAGENRLNDINLQQQGVIDEANQQIANLESQGRFEEANILAQQNLAKIQALISSQQRQDEIAREDRLRAEDIARQQEQIDYTRQQDTDALARQDFQTGIAANYRDLSAYANQLRLQGAPQWQIDMVEAARQQKIIDQNLDPRTGQPLPVDTTPVLTSSSAALDLWKQLGTANQAIANALGVNVGERYRNLSTGGSGSTSTNVAGLTPNNVAGLTPKETISLTENALRGTSGNSSADLMVQLNEQGYFDNLTPSELKTLMNKFGVTELMLEQAENRSTIPTQGIPLPSQMGGLYGNFNNRQ